jgi:hypothetical protein
MATIIGLAEAAKILNLSEERTTLLAKRQQIPALVTYNRKLGGNKYSFVKERLIYLVASDFWKNRHPGRGKRR